MLSDFIHVQAKAVNTKNDAPNKVLIYLICGNPALIEYYREFLDHLAINLKSDNASVQYELCGRSFAGFEIESNCRKRRKPPPYTLQEQVTNVHNDIADAVSTSRQDSRSGDSRSVPVILIGHSVGAYILLEIIARQQQAQRNGSTLSEYEILGGICLFPTIVDIAKSYRGRIATPIATLPGFALVIHWIARALCFLIPASVLLHLVQRITGMPSHASKTTTAFLRSKNGVYSALYMAKHELLEITHDRWSDDVWDISTPTVDQQDRPQLFFYWGEDDHWVDNRARNEVIAKRARRPGDDDGKGKPWMEIDALGVPHAFCIRQSQSIAEKVAGYIGELLRGGSGGDGYLKLH